MTQITTMVWSHHLEPDNLECEVKWALGSITMNKASGDDGIPAELFKILKDAVKMLHSVCQQIWKTQQWPQDWKSSIFTPRKGNAKECPGYSTVVLILYASKVTLKVLQARLQYMNRELPDIQVGFRKGRGPEIKLSTFVESERNQGFTAGSDGKESCNVGDLGSISGLGRSPGRWHGNPLQYSCLGNPHGQSNLVGYSPWSHKELDIPGQLST